MDRRDEVKNFTKWLAPLESIDQIKVGILDAGIRSVTEAAVKAKSYTAYLRDAHSVASNVLIERQFHQSVHSYLGEFLTH